MAESRREELQRILQLDEAAVRNDTLFAAARKQQPKDQRETLIIGIGGSGVDSVYTSYRLIREKLNPNFNNYVKFIAIDAEGDKLDYAKKKGIPCLNLSTPGATDRISKYENRPDFYKKWMRKDFYYNFDDDGAGRIRMVGKAKLYDRSEDGGTTNDNRLRGLILKVIQGFQRNLPLDIILVGGVSGGTGGGTLIDVAAMARAVCLGRQNVRLYGYLFLPDTVEEVFSDDNDKRQVYSNGYAFLKELESYMCLMQNPERREELRVPENPLIPIVTLDNNTPLFDDVVLMSGKYRESKNLISECLANMVGKMSNNNFSHEAFYSNKSAARAAKLCSENATNGGLLKAGFHCEDSHAYSGIGVSTASIPEEIVIPNIVGNTCERLYRFEEEAHFRGKDNPPTREEAKAALQHFFNWNENTALKEGSIWTMISAQTRSKSLLSENKGVITAADIASGNTKNYEAGFHMEAQKANASREMKKWLQKQYENFTEQAKEIMYHDGPRMIRFLYDGTGPCDKNGIPENYEDISLKRMLEEVETQLRKEKLAVSNPPSGDVVKSGVLGKISNAISGNVDKWKANMKRHLEAEIRIATYGVLSGDNGLYAVELKRKIEAFIERCETFAEIVEMMGNFYRGKGRSLDADNYQVFHDAGDNGININLCDNDDIFTWVKSKVKNKINSVNMQDLRRELVNDFMLNQESWSNGPVGEARGRFDGILSKCCRVGAKAPVDEEAFSLDVGAYFDKKLEGVADQDLFNRARDLIHPIVDRLLDKGYPSLNTREHRPANCFIFLPQTLSVGKYSTVLIQAFNNEVSAQNSSVLISDMATKIICYQTTVANALYELNDIAKWEAAYEGGYGQDIHLNQGETGPFVEEMADTADETERSLFGRNLSWSHYPALALNLDHAGNPNSKEGEFLRTLFNPLFEYALKEKIIFRSGNAREGYYYQMCVIPPQWTDLRIDGYGLKDNGRLMRGKPLFEYWESLPANRESGQVRIVKDILLQSSGYFSVPFEQQAASNAHVTDELFDAKVLEYTKAILRKDTHLFRQLRDTVNRYWKIGKRMDEYDSIIGLDHDIEAFIRYLETGLIYQEGEEWLIKEYGGNTALLCSFGLKDTLLFTGKEKAIYEQMELRLPIILDRFIDCAMYRENKEELENQYRNLVLNQNSNEELRELIAGHCAEHKEELEKYRSLIDSLRRGYGDKEAALKDMLPGSRSDKELVVYKLNRIYEELGKDILKY